MTRPGHPDGVAPILYLIGGRGIGGQETHLLHLAERLDRKRFEPVICCMDLGEDYAARIDAAHTRRFNLAAPNITTPSNFVRLGRLPTLLRTVKPAVVHSFGFASDQIGPSLRLIGPRLRVVTTRRGIDDVPRHCRMRSLGNRLTDVILCVSDEVAAFTRATESLHRARIRVIPNGVVIPGATPPFRTASPGRGGEAPLRFGTLGSVRPVKGTDILVDAFLRFGREDACELHIAGVMDRYQQWVADLVGRVEAAGARDRIHFHGYRADSSAFLESLDVFVLPSRSEGMSNALLEAMAAGLPCVVTNVGSNASVLAPPDEQRPGGLVVETEPEPLHEALRRMLTEEKSRREWAEGAYQRAVRVYSMEAMLRAYEILYEELLSGMAPALPGAAPAGQVSP